MQRALLLLVVVAFIPRAAAAQGPVGPEFRINTHTTGSQREPAVGLDSSGNFIVVWQSDSQDGSKRGIFGQRYDSSGAPLGPEFLVNTYTTRDQREPAVASDSSGNFVVVWQSGCSGYPPCDAQDGSDWGVFGQRYDSTGAPLGPEFRVNTHTTDWQREPAVASDSSGNFVVVWESFQDFFELFGQLFASSGAPLGREFRVNTYTTGVQYRPAVASGSSGNFLVVWNSEPGDIFGRICCSSTGVVGPDFRVNTYTTANQYKAAVASDSFGNFVVVWMSDEQDGSNWGVFGQRYDSSGAPLGPEFRVNTYTTSDQAFPTVASDSSGNFVVVWQSDTQDGFGRGVFGQRYDSSGAPLGAEFRVNTYTTWSQVSPAVAASSSGNFVVVWMSDKQDGSDWGVFGQRYSAIAPAE